MDKWEYKILKESEFEKSMDELGKQGWEVCAAPVYVSSYGSATTYVLKRKTEPSSSDKILKLLPEMFNKLIKAVLAAKSQKTVQQPQKPSPKPASSPKKEVDPLGFLFK